MNGSIKSYDEWKNLKPDVKDFYLYEALKDRWTPKIWAFCGGIGGGAVVVIAVFSVIKI